MKTKTEVKHTPTPWYISSNENGITTIRGDKANGRLFAVADTIKEEDATFIVRAVNSHETLLEAVKHYSICGFRNEVDCDKCAAAELAIAQAEGGK